MSRTRIFIGLGLAALFQTALLSQMVWSQITLLGSPTEVVLQTAPVDPRDIFRGDYVTLNYEISSITNNTIPVDHDLKPGQDAYVLLKIHTPFATPLRVTASRPETLNPGEAIIRGTVNWSNQGASPTDKEDCTDCPIISLSYPIDSYFVPEGTGKEIEEHRNARALGVIIALNAKGDAAIKGLMMDGEKIYDTPLF